jgi:uncharacterized protein YwqG
VRSLFRRARRQPASPSEPHDPVADVDAIVAGLIAEGHDPLHVKDPPTLRRADVDGLARDVGLSTWASRIAASAVPSLRLRLVEAESSVDGSRIGGEPALPEGHAWPDRGGRPLAFIGQIQLSDVAAAGGAFGVPRTGLLSFFYDASKQPWGFDPADRSGSVVYWFPEGSSLARRPLPPDLATSDRFAAFGLAMEPEWTVPNWFSTDGLVVDLMAAETGDDDVDLGDRYVDLADRLAGSPARDLRFRLFGHPDLIQGDMREECELVTHGHYAGGAQTHAPDRERHRSNASAWRLLLQIDSDDALGTMWGDAGRLYVWIRDDALVARRFSEAWLVLQCT